MKRLLRPLWVFLAIVFLIEAWLWDHLEPIVARVVARLPLARMKAAIADAVRPLPPWATLVVFVVPPVLLFPLKLIGFWLLAGGHWLMAGGVILFAKLFGLGVTAFIFDLTRDKLLVMPWFRRIYDGVMWLRDRAHALVDPIRRRIALRLKLWRRLFAPRRASRTLRLLGRIRRRMHAAAS